MNLRTSRNASRVRCLFTNSMLLVRTEDRSHVPCSEDGNQGHHGTIE